MEIKNNLDTWLAIDLLDAEGIVCDVIKWENDTYTISFNIFTDICKDLKIEDAENQEIPFKGFSLHTQIEGTTLQELYYKLNVLIAVGILDADIMSNQGTVFDADGNELSELDWSEFNEEGTDDFTDEDPFEGLFKSKKPMTLH
jgi:hypothetical protein